MDIDIVKEMIKKQSDILKKVNDGDYSDVCYFEGNGLYGIYDKNYTNRLRLVYYILFENIDNEDIVKRLFEEELKDRETNSFQGIGSSLEILTYLLMKYNDKNKYDELFKRAKNANFDCACGYGRNLKIESDLNKYDIYECINIAIETEYTDYAKKLVECWKESITDWNKQSYKTLIYFNKNIDNEVENEEVFKALLNIEIKNGKNYDVISAWRNLIHYYIKFDKCEEAYKSFTDMIKSVKLSEVYDINLFNFILEDCMELICKYDEEAKTLWKWAKPFVKKKAKDMYGNLYKKSIKASEAVNDNIAKELSKEYNLWKKRVSL